MPSSVPSSVPSSIPSSNPSSVPSSVPSSPPSPAAGVGILAAHAPPSQGVANVALLLSATSAPVESFLPSDMDDDEIPGGSTSNVETTWQFADEKKDADEDIWSIPEDGDSNPSWEFADENQETNEENGN